MVGTLEYQFKQLEYEMFLGLKEIAQEISQKSEQAIQAIRDETERKAQRDLLKLHQESLNEAQRLLNLRIDEAVASLNSSILKKKNEYYRRFLEELAVRVVENIQHNPVPYWRHISTKVIDATSQLSGEIVLIFNGHDAEVLKKTPNHLKLPGINYSISSHTVRCIGGCLIQALDGFIEIDLTIDEELRRKNPMIALRFYAILPDYVDHQDTARDLLLTIMNSQQEGEGGAS
jgi:vacuolar-type H+-ATPase subunit E/Vma4